MHKNKSVQIISTLAIVMYLLFLPVITLSLTATSYAEEDNQLDTIQKKIEVRRQRTQKKINELKLREKKEINKLYQSQSILEKTTKDLNLIQTNYLSLKRRLNKIQYKLNTAKAKYSKQEQLAGKRLKQISKGERISILHVIFASDSVNELMDRIYFQEIVTNKDKNILAELRNQSADCEKLLSLEESQKKNILYALNLKKRKKQKIANSISTSQYLINRLRTDRETYEQAEKELAQQSEKIASMLKNGIKGANIQIGAVGRFEKPISGRISSPFGWRTHPIFGSRSFHSGVDIAGLNRNPVKASNSGKVVYSGWYGGYGKVVIINHGNYNAKPTSTLYAHLNRTAVKVGDSIDQGQCIGYEGTTGYSTGPHVHFEVRVNGKPNNPMNFIK